MPSRDIEELSRRLERLEQIVKDDEGQMKPVIDAFNASKLLGRIMFIFGGMIVGVATIIGAIGKFFGKAP